MDPMFDLPTRVGGAARPGVIGYPALNTQQIIHPLPYTLVESASIWKEFEVSRPIKMWIPDATNDRIIRAVPERMHYEGATQIAKNAFHQSVDGVLEIWFAGRWFLNTPIVTAEGTQVEAIYADAALSVANPTGGGESSPDMGKKVNIWKIRGTPQTGVDYFGKWLKRTPVNPGAVANITNASASALAARTGRTYLYVHASNFAGGCSRVTINFGNAAVDRRGHIFYDTEWKVWDATTGIFEGAVHAITDVGTADLTFVEAT